ncbi:MAG: Xaa-Pro aminopeptidase [Proteobacteria bacterium]|nr:Xaa-Pro aminopeptidase [Pseudomonadota bacterium]
MVIQASNEYGRRRRDLMNMMSEGGVAVVPGSSAKLRSRDVDYPFRQDSDFFYLTGFSEPDAVLVLVPSRDHGEVILFCPERDPKFERWNGERLGPERAAQMLGVDDAFPISDLDEILPGLLEGKEKIYVTLGDYPDLDQRLLGWVKGIRAREAGGAIGPGEFVALKHYLHELRLIKSAGEIKLMREAGRITSVAHKRAMAAAKPGMTETELEAELTYEFMRNGARSSAYPSIVGSGANSCILHYVDNDAVMNDGDLVLIDAGCEYQHYAADVTRTFPVGERFSDPQRAIYEIVLKAQKAAIEVCRPGMGFNEPHETALRTLVEGLVELGLLNGEVGELIENNEHLRFCPHKTSHWLGIDVHDVGDYRVDGHWRELEPGMVLTVEPGIYIQDNDTNDDLDPRFRGIGVRIEDDVLITRKGHEVLTISVPKEIAQIEAIRSRATL